MNDPKRLLRGDDFGAKLLASARSDAPARASKKRIAAAVGLSLGGAALTTAGGSAAAVASMGWVKIAVCAAVAVTATAGGVLATRSAEDASRTAPATVVARAPSAALRDEPPSRAMPVTEASIAEAASSEPPSAPASADAERTAPARRASPVNAADSPLAQELRALDVAKTALDRGDAVGALRGLDDYDRSFATRGALRMEASMLRVEALLVRGDAVSARRLAAELLARDPSGPHARRLRAIAEKP